MLSVRVGEQVFWSQIVPINAYGIGRAVFPAGTPLPTTANLCAHTPWPIAQQRHRPAFAKPGENVVCDDGFSRYVREGNGKTPDKAYGVVAIKSRG